MRFMGWSYDDLMQCPQAYIEVIVEVGNEEAKEAKRQQRSARGSRGRR